MKLMICEYRNHCELAFVCAHAKPHEEQSDCSNPCWRDRYDYRRDKPICIPVVDPFCSERSHNENRRE